MSHPNPPTTPEVYDRLHMLQLIDDALRQTPFCACGQMMTVDGEGDSLYLECPTFQEAPSGRLSRLRSGVRLVLHQRQLLARDIAIAA
jgi:hypothetical protein